MNFLTLQLKVNAFDLTSAAQVNDHVLHRTNVAKYRISCKFALTVQRKHLHSGLLKVEL